MNFAISYSYGKDSALALHRMIKNGHTPVCIITTVNEDAKRSWFHGVGYNLMDAVADSLRLPLIKCICNGDTYNTEFEKCLMQARKMGGESCVFGDIDLEGHLEWDRERCASAGIECIVPLWKTAREQVISEVLNCGISATIKCVWSEYLEDSFLGCTLDYELVQRIKKTKSDICGENGEYHTFVFNSPDFRRPIDIALGDIIDFGSHSAIDIRLKDK